MLDRQCVRDIQAPGEVRSVFLVGAASLQQSRNGPYWRLELRDATGRVEAKIWSPLSAAFPSIEPGRMAEVEASAGLYREQVQLTINALRVLTPEEQADVPLGDFLPSSPRDPQAMLAEAETLCGSVLTHAPWRAFAASVLSDENIRRGLLSAPAAKSIHHAYVGGLLEHSLSVAGMCLRMADHYPEIDRQMLFIAALFHDIGKLEEMSGGLVNDYTDSGRLLGHIVQGLLMLEPFLAASGLESDLITHFRHLIASHHGELEYGAARVPATAEAFALHYADNLDAKLAQWRGLFPAEANGDAMEWSPWQQLLERQLCRPVRTPEEPVVQSAAPADHADAAPEQQPEGVAEVMRGEIQPDLIARRGRGVDVEDVVPGQDDTPPWDVSVEYAEYVGWRIPDPEEPAGQAEQQAADEPEEPLVGPAELEILVGLGESHEQPDQEDAAAPGAKKRGKSAEARTKSADGKGDGQCSLL